MVRVIIESDKPIAINVKKDDGTARLLRDIKEGAVDESNDKTFTANAATTN